MKTNYFMKKNHPKGKKGKWISAHERLSIAVSNETTIIGREKVKNKLLKRKMKKRGTKRIKRQQRTTHYLDTKISEDSFKSNFYFYNWNEEESESLLLKYKSIEVRKVENIENFDIIDNASYTHNVLVLDSVTKVTIWQSISLTSKGISG